MPSVITLSKYIRKKEKQLKKQQNKLVFAKELPDKAKAKDEIERLEKELLDLRQKLAYQQAMNEIEKERK